MLDGLGAIAESFMAHGLGARTGGERHMVLLRTSRAQLAGETFVGGRIDGGPVVPPETAQRLSCDASVVEVIVDGVALVGVSELDVSELEVCELEVSDDEVSDDEVSDDEVIVGEVTEHQHRARVLDIGRRTRSIPPAIRRALTVRDEGCRFPGCSNTRYVDAHHIKHWADGGETKLENLVLLCHRHHRLVHEGGYSLREDFSFWNPEGRQLHEAATPLPVATEPPPADPVGLIPWVRSADLTMATEGVRWVERRQHSRAG